MNRINFKKANSQEGITLFVTLILMGVLLGISASLLNITLKQHQLAGVSYASEVAFQAANAGMECALYHDWNDDIDAFTSGKQGPFDVPTTGVVINCMGINDSGPFVGNGAEQRFQFTWGTPSVCTEFSVYKFFDASNPVAVELTLGNPLRGPCPAGSECTVIQSRGYNVACTDIGSGARVVEREYTQVY